MGKISIEIPEQLAATARQLTGKRSVAAAFAAVVAKQQQDQLRDAKGRLAQQIVNGEKRSKGKGDRSFRDTRSAVAFIRAL